MDASLRESLAHRGVAAGWARHCDIRLELVADDPKAVEIELAPTDVVYRRCRP
jgi:hypothetical protein